MADSSEEENEGDEAASDPESDSDASTLVLGAEARGGDESEDRSDEGSDAEEEDEGEEPEEEEEDEDDVDGGEEEDEKEDEKYEKYGKGKVGKTREEKGLAIAAAAGAAIDHSKANSSTNPREWGKFTRQVNDRKNFPVALAEYADKKKFGSFWTMA